MKQPTMLEKVSAELENRLGDLRGIAKACGVSYDTVLRIKNRKHDPAFGNVQVLHDYLFPVEAAAHTEKQAA